jgi:hypothetical protein
LLNVVHQPYAVGVIGPPVALVQHQHIGRPCQQGPRRTALRQSRRFKLERYGDVAAPTAGLGKPVHSLFKTVHGAQQAFVHQDLPGLLREPLVDER